MMTAPAPPACSSQRGRMRRLLAVCNQLRASSLVGIQLAWSEHVWRRGSGPRLPATGAMGACLIPGKRALSPGSPLPRCPEVSRPGRPGRRAAGEDVRSIPEQPPRSNEAPRLAAAFIHTHTHTHECKHTSVSSNRLLSLPENQRSFQLNPNPASRDQTSLSCVYEQRKKRKKQVKIVFTCCPPSLNSPGRFQM